MAKFTHTVDAELYDGSIASVERIKEMIASRDDCTCCVEVVPDAFHEGEEFLLLSDIDDLFAKKGTYVVINDFGDVVLFSVIDFNLFYKSAKI